MKTFLSFLVILAIIGGGIVWSARHPSAVITNEETPAETSVLGCYAYPNGNNLYTLNIASKNGNVISGTLHFDNAGFDSSSGTFVGTYTAGILLGKYEFDSEGTHSIRQVIFKKTDKGFLQGSGETAVVNGEEKFTEIGKVAFDTEREFVGAPCGISVTQEKFAETNFSGQKPVIVGTGVLADTARAYVEKSIEDFKVRADTEVPGILKEFGPESSASKYTIDITAKYMEGEKTHSIIVNEYIYTGGANGNNIYKVFTASRKSGAILTINDVIQKDKQNAFVTFVQKKLNDDSKKGTGISVFPEDVKALTVNSFDDFAFDKTNVYIYFDKYQIAPGASGAPILTLPLTSVQSYLASLE